MENYYEIASVPICVSGNDEQMYTDERLLQHFKIKNEDIENNAMNRDLFRFEFSIQDTFVVPTGTCVFQGPSRRIYINGQTEIRYIGSVMDDVRNAYLRTVKTGNLILVQIKRDRISGRIGTKTVLNALAMERLALEGNGVVLHASYVVHNGQAILFTAPSGTGKSTQANLWKELRGARIINGDRAIVRASNGQIFACGLPFAGSSIYCENVTAPLAGIVYLGQSEECQIQRLSGGQAFCRIWEGCSVASWSSQDVEKAMFVVQDVIKQVPVYHLQCRPDESAVVALEEKLIGHTNCCLLHSYEQCSGKDGR